MKEYYKKIGNKEIVSKREADNQSKLISLYNQLNGTSYDLNSVGIEVVRKVNPGNYNYGTGKPDVNFGWRTRTGVQYSNWYTEEEKKDLQGR